MAIFGKGDAPSGRQRPSVNAPSASTRRCILRFLTAITMCVISARSSQSAEVRRGLGADLVLEGEIAGGDYEKIRDFIEEEQAQSIYLASPGGNLAEAIKIGRLLRKLKFKTVIPTRGALGQHWAARDIKDLNTTTCAPVRASLCLSLAFKGKSPIVTSHSCSAFIVLFYQKVI